MRRFRSQEERRLHPKQEKNSVKSTGIIKVGNVILLKSSSFFPIYARGNVAVVIERYKRLNRYNLEYWNYYTTLMILNGPCIGRKRTYVNMSRNRVRKLLINMI